MAELDRRRICARSLTHSDCPALRVPTAVPASELLSDHHTPGNKHLTTPCGADVTCVHLKIQKHAPR